MVGEHLLKDRLVHRAGLSGPGAPGVEVAPTGRVHRAAHGPTPDDTVPAPPHPGVARGRHGAAHAAALRDGPGRAAATSTGHAQPEEWENHDDWARARRGAPADE